MKNFGGALGVITACFVFGWIGIHLFEKTKNDRLPIKIKQYLVQLQKRLPMKLADGLILEEFEFNLASARIVLRLDSIEKNQLSKIRKTEIEIAVQVIVCAWRHNTFRDLRNVIEYKILDRQGSLLANARNTAKVCENLPSMPPARFEA